MKFIKKIFKTIIFALVLIVSIITSGLLTFLVGKIFFGVSVFKMRLIKLGDCPYPPPPGCGFQEFNPMPITIFTYPFYIIFILFFIAFVFIYSYLIIKHLFKD